MSVVIFARYYNESFFLFVELFKSLDESNKKSRRTNHTYDILIELIRVFRLYNSRIPMSNNNIKHNN